VTFESQKLRDASNGQSCVRCGARETVVGAHYTGARRHAYGGGLSKKVHDFLIADLCGECHRYMDQLARASAGKDGIKEFLHSEEFLHLIALTLERRFVQGVIIVKGQREPRFATLPKIVPRRVYVESPEGPVSPVSGETPAAEVSAGGAEVAGAARVGPEAVGS
jgi:hypothetical protein